MKKSQIPSLAIILITAALLRFPLVSQGFFAFTTDQGRDLLAVKDIVENLNLTLIGPTTGLPGIFYGPWWYYFLSPLFFISQGNVQTIAVIFAAIGVATIVLLYLLIKKVTSNIAVALFAAATAAMSGPFINSSSQIWSPSLVLPLMTAYVFSLHKILQKNPAPLWFLTLGASCALIADSGAAFGIMLTVATIVTGVFFKINFSGKNFSLFFLGIVLVLLPRIIFDLRNDFLITKSAINWITAPSIYQENLTLVQRMINRLDMFYLNFAQTFAQSSKLLATIPLAILIFSLAKAKVQLLANSLFKFLLTIVFLIFLGFTLFPDAVWDYYLAGLPIIFTFLLVFALAQIPAKNKIYLPIFIFVLLAVNFRPKILSPFSITWQGDGAVYRNQIRVIDDLKNELKGDYSLFIYSPSGTDYPFHYILGYYHKTGQIDLPEDGQRRMYLILRDDQTHSFMPTGWYGDKTRNKTKLQQRREYTGNIIVEKHERQ